MTVTTSDIERVATRVRAEIATLTACVPAHADIIWAAVLVRVGRELGEEGHQLQVKRRPQSDLTNARAGP